MTQKRFLQFNIIVASLVISACAYANNLSVANVSLGLRNPSAKTLVVTFDLSWQNSWRNKINHDAVWLTVRMTNTASPENGSRLCSIATSGLNPAGSSIGSASNIEIDVPNDRVGAFIRRSSNGAVANVASTGVQLTVDYNSCGFADNDQAAVNIVGIEMVLVPEGTFYAGDNSTSTASLNKGSADSSPWYIASENAVSVGNPVSNGFRYVSASNSGEFATGTTFTIPATYPKGYAPFYVMKYEITEGQWVDFVNSLSSTARLNRDITDNNHKNSDSVITRNTISCSGSPLVCTTLRSTRAATFLSWMDLAAFLDWAGLRPMSELEFEKIARGPVLPVNGEYVWGTTDNTSATTIVGTENGAETVSGGNANFANTSLSGGDASSGLENQLGALRGGIFATASSDRVAAGGSYYGVMEMSGNVAEHVVTLGNATGLNFNAQHGDGLVNSIAGAEGNANVANWPGTDADVSKGVTGAEGSGIKGGSWLDAASLLRTSDRAQAALTTAAATGVLGGRGVRSYDGQ